MFVYFWSIKICALGFNELLENIFCLLLIVEAFSLRKVVEMLEEVVVSWQEVRWIWWMRQNILAQLFQLLKHCLYNVRFVVVRENWTHSVHQYWLQAFQFSENLIDLLNILLRCNGFTGIQKAIVDLTSSRPPSRDHDSFFGASLTLGSALELRGPTTELDVASCCMHFSLRVTTRKRNCPLLHKVRENVTSKWWFFFWGGSAHETPLNESFHLFNLLQMSNDHRMVSVEFLGDFSCSS